MSTVETRGATVDWSTRLLVLDDVDAHPGTMPGMIAARTGLNRRTVTHHVAKLEAAGVVYRDPPRGASVRVWPV